MNALNIKSAQVLVVEQSGMLKAYPLTGDQFIIGRTGGPNDISINANFVSAQHGIITNMYGMFVYNDLASTNGTYINDHLVHGTGDTPSAPVPLKDGDIICIGNRHTSEKIYIVFSYGGNYDWRSISLNSTPRITIGRGSDNLIVVPNIMASRKHAVINNNGSNIIVTDLNSVNGTIVDGNMCRGTVPFNDRSVIRLETTKIMRLGDNIVYSIPVAAKPTNVESYANNISSQSLMRTDNETYEIAREGGVEVVVQDISRIVPCKKGTGINGGNKKVILDHISLRIAPGELVAILGGSGAGKTTFMNCINGFEPATEGVVLVNSSDLYKNYQAIKSSIGYVPQQDIVHDDLTLEDMLTYTAKLRLPKDVTKQEMCHRVAEVLDMVDLTEQKDTFIKKLSGGQRKRASIAVELVSDPSLFFLDEPTSGLDPEAETNLMHRLKNLSQNKGKTVIVITHTLQNIRLFDKVIFLAPGGKLCFYGSPSEAEKFFGVDNLADAYEKISKDVDGYVTKYDEFVRKGRE